MEEKIKSAKIAILNRIEKAVNDDTKSLSVETLTAMSDIINSFDIHEIERNAPNKYFEIIKSYIDNALNKENTVSAVSAPVAIEAEGI